MIKDQKASRGVEAQSVIVKSTGCDKKNMIKYVMKYLKKKT